VRVVEIRHPGLVACQQEAVLVQGELLKDGPAIVNGQCVWGVPPRPPWRAEGERVQSVVEGENLSKLRSVCQTSAMSNRNNRHATKPFAISHRTPLPKISTASTEYVGIISPPFFSQRIHEQEESTWERSLVSIFLL